MVQDISCLRRKTVIESPKKPQNCSSRGTDKAEEETMFGFGDDNLVIIPAKSMVYYCCGLPLGAFLTCVLLAIFLHGDGSTRTHCNVDNYLPSTSAAIGDYTPERYIWRICIALHTAPRFVVAVAYKNFYWTSPLRPVSSKDSNSWFNFLCWLICILHWGENLALVLLSCVSSTENYDIHESAFISFMVCSLLYMLLTLFMFNESGRRRASTLGEKSFQYKFFLFGICIGSFVVSLYFFYRHNVYCETGVYTLFALSEYIVIVSNILFHGTAKLDLHDRRVILTAGGPNDWHIIPESDVATADKKI